MNTIAANRIVTVRVELGRCLLPADQVVGLGAGSVVELEAMADDGVDVYADGQLCARGKAVTIDGQLAVKIGEVLPRHAPPGGLR